MTDYITALVGAAALMIGGSMVMLRPATTRGQHRSPFRQPPLLQRPIDALDTVAALCSTEGRVTRHARVQITRQFMCLDCHNPSRDPASYETREEAPHA
jgi:hypothetical protein